jgi:hypothetical protein
MPVPICAPARLPICAQARSPIRAQARRLRAHACRLPGYAASASIP